jgi:hypothetical protein
VLEIVDLPEPHPGPGEVRIAVRAAGVNASDWKKRQGEMNPDLPQTLVTFAANSSSLSPNARTGAEGRLGVRLASVMACSTTSEWMPDDRLCADHPR